MDYLIESLLNTEMQYALWAAGVMVLLPGMSMIWIARRLSGFRLVPVSASGHRPNLERIDERLNHLCSAMSLLTDSTESGLRDALSEIERLSRTATAPPARQRAAVQRRVKGAARRGRTAREIAVAEGVSEGEVRLRLGMLASTPLEATPRAEVR
jgi:hypothetical protein